MEQLPILAEIFHVSVDKLLGVGVIMEEKKVNEYPPLRVSRQLSIRVRLMTA